MDVAGPVHEGRNDEGVGAKALGPGTVRHPAKDPVARSQAHHITSQYSGHGQTVVPSTRENIRAQRTS